MTYHENPVGIPVGTNVAITYDTGTTYTGTVTGPGLMTDTSGRSRSLIIDGDRVTMLGDAKDDLETFKRQVSKFIADLTETGLDEDLDDEQIEGLYEQVGLERAKIDLAAQQKRDRDHAEITLADFKRETSDLLVQIGRDYGILEDYIDDMHDRLGIGRPKAEPINVEVTVKVAARLTPTSRRAARDVGHGSFLADSVVGLDLIDFDADSFEVDLLDGINVEVEDWNVTY